MLFSNLILAVVPLFVALLPQPTTALSTQCASSCADWSVVLGFCEGVFGNAAASQNYSVANAFVSCLCMGNEASGALGNDTFASSVNTCQQCTTTPVIVQKQLTQLTALCATQVSNGTAADALLFNPIPYTTSNQPTAVNLLASSGMMHAQPLTVSGALLLVATVLGASLI